MQLQRFDEAKSHRGQWRQVQPELEYAARLHQCVLRFWFCVRRATHLAIADQLCGRRRDASTKAAWVS